MSTQEDLVALGALRMRLRLFVEMLEGGSTEAEPYPGDDEMMQRLARYVSKSQSATGPSMTDTLDAGIAIGRADVVQAVRAWLDAFGASPIANDGMIRSFLNALVKQYADEATAESTKRHAGKTREQMIAEIEAKEAALSKPILPDSNTLPTDDAPVHTKVTP